MMQKSYKDYTIVVSKQKDNIGGGHRAWFYIQKGNGLKENVQGYFTYRRKRYGEVFDDVKKIIDALG